MMHRNLDRRVEALVRLVDPAHLAEIGGLFDQAMDDSTSTWHLGGRRRVDPPLDRRSRAAAHDLQNRQMLEIGQRKRTGKRR